MNFKQYLQEQQGISGWISEFGEYVQVPTLKHRDYVVDNPEKFGYPDSKDVPRLIDFIVQDGQVHISQDDRRGTGIDLPPNLSNDAFNTLKRVLQKSGKEFVWVTVEGSGVSMQTLPVQKILSLETPEQLINYATAENPTDIRQFLEDASDIPKGDRSCIVIPGRFVIPHKAHIAMFRQAWNKYDADMLVIAVVMGEKSSQDQERNPTNFKQRKEMINQVLNIPHKVIKVPSAWLGALIEASRNLNIEPKYLIAGPDRFQSYKNMERNYADEMNSNIEVIERDPIPVEGIRGTALRQAIRNGDKEEFIRMVPPQLHGWWDDLIDILELE